MNVVGPESGTPGRDTAGPENNVRRELNGRSSLVGASPLAYPAAMSIPESAYLLTSRFLRAVSPIFPLGDSKLGEGLKGRRAAAARLSEWGQGRDSARPLVWLHAPSVGEAFQAQATLQALQSEVPNAQVLFTFFSPSAESVSSRMGADVASYLPWDVRGDLRRVISAVRPSVISFTKTEVWPGLSLEAERAGVPTALIAGTLPEGSSRLRAGARLLLTPSFARLRRVGAISVEDGARFSRLGVNPTRVRVTGDPGIDSAARRVAVADPDASHLRPFRGIAGSVLVAGSTWPSDERLLREALRQIRESHPGLRVLVAPHEPGEGVVARLLSEFRQDGWRVSTLAEVEARGDLGDVQVVVVERVGVLADLYTVGTVAYVGGGFHSAGLHSVLEPAAAGLPVLFGPGHQHAPAAGDLLRAGGGSVVQDAESLGALLGKWLSSPTLLTEAGRCAQGYIDSHAGAGLRSAELLRELLQRGSAEG